MKQPEQLSQDDVLLNRITQTVLDNLENEQFGVETLAEEIGMSRSHLHRKLKKLNGQSISQFIRDIRLEEALKLLRQDVGTASEIAYRVGFNSSSYFHKCFLARYGYPPSEARNQERDVPVLEAPILVTPEADHSTSPRLPIGWKAIGIAIAGLVLLLGVGYWTLSPMEPIETMSVGQSIAVLPFTNLSEEVENQHFADGLVEDLLSRLSLVEQFKVISRTSSDTYRERGAKTVPEIARELGVSHIVEGSVQKQGNKVRIAVQLIDAQQDQHVWAASFDRDLADVFSIQSDIAMRVAIEMRAVLTNEQTARIQKNRTESVRAFELYQLGRFHWNKRTMEGFNTSIEYYEQALVEDSLYSLAYAGLADTYSLMAQFGGIDRQWGRNKAEALAFKALELDENLPEAYTVLGDLYTVIDMNWPEAEKAFLRSIELNSNFSTGQQYYANFLIITGRSKEARARINKALELDPLSYVIRFCSLVYYYWDGNFTEALRELETCQEFQKDHHWLSHYGLKIHYRLGDTLAAVASLKKDVAFARYCTPTEIDSVFGNVGFNRLLGWAAEQIMYPYRQAEWYVLLGKEERGLEMLEKAFKEDVINVHVYAEYDFLPFHTDPRFIALLNQMNLPWEPDTSPY